MDLKDLSRILHLILTGLAFFIILNQMFFVETILVYAENEYTFTPDTWFEIKSNNSSIRFSTNGTYEKAILENGKWTFYNLHFINSQNREKINLTVSAINCQVAINFYIVYNRTFDGEPTKSAILRYTVNGLGTQIFNLDLDPKKGELDAILNGEWVGKNHGWTHSSDGTFTITGATENVTLLYYGYPQSFVNNTDFFANHSVILTSTFSFGI
ncbi:MAG: hypothetical protein P8Y18_12235 [Candidatus Bathyarchaeota archaeon]